MRMPISRVRSVTQTSMMFMIPTPPTISEMPAIDESISVIVPVIIPSTLAISVVFCTLKVVRLAGVNAVPLGQELRRSRARRRPSTGSELGRARGWR